MLGTIQNYLLNRKISRLKRKVHVFNLNTASTAIILYTFAGEKREKLLRDYAKSLKEEGIKVTTLAYIPKKIKEEDQMPIEELSYYYFDKSEANKLKIPNSTRIAKLMKTDFNLLIDLNVEDSFPIKWISALSKANFKVGGLCQYHSEICDLTLSLESKDIPEFMEQSKVYLEMINKK